MGLGLLQNGFKMGLGFKPWICRKKNHPLDFGEQDSGDPDSDDPREETSGDTQVEKE